MLDVSRRELKYLVSDSEVSRIAGRLSAVMRQDAHNGDKGYLVRSLYFDTLSDRDFEDKVDGYDKRQKIRLRVYDINADTAKLELKEKEGNAQRKRSLLVNRREAQQMIEGDYTFLLERDETLAKYLYTFMMMNCYRPKCVVEYDRLAFYADTNDIRITFDRNLRATEADFELFRSELSLYPVANRAETTMEVKYSGFLFTYMKDIINMSDRMQISNSKYCRARTISKKGRI